MTQIRLYWIISVLIVSAMSLIWVVTLWVKISKLKKILIYLVSFSAWWLLWWAFLHLLPESSENWFTITTALYVLWWLTFWLITEKVIHRNHCHMPITKTHVHSFAIMNLVWDFVHNIIDWIIIWASYLVSIPTGIATTLAVILHEIPQEIWDFGVLIHGWFSKKKALLVNLLTWLSSVIWLIAVLILWKYTTANITEILLPFAAWSFIYIAVADLIPELHKENKTWQALLQVMTFLLWIWFMWLLLLRH